MDFSSERTSMIPGAFFRRVANDETDRPLKSKRGGPTGTWRLKLILVQFQKTFCFFYFLVS